MNIKAPEEESFEIHKINTDRFRRRNRLPTIRSEISINRSQKRTDTAKRKTVKVEKKKP